jgi:hypothetical protein
MGQGMRDIITTPSIMVYFNKLISNYMKLHFLKVGATGTVTIINYQTIAGTCNKTREQKHNIIIDEVRTKDFIVLREGIPDRMYCMLPTNKKDGSEKFWLTDDENGFIRQYHDSFTDNRGLVDNIVETIYQFNN